MVLPILDGKLLSPKETLVVNYNAAGCA